jgi:hypothetical protein
MLRGGVSSRNLTLTMSSLSDVLPRKSALIRRISSVISAGGRQSTRAVGSRKAA